MGIAIAPLYGNADVGSAIEDVEKVIAKIKSNDFSNKDLIALYKANAEVLKAVLDNEYKD